MYQEKLKINGDKTEFLIIGSTQQLLKTNFCVAAPTLWNALPASLRNTTSLFKSCLKTYPFKLAFDV